MGWPGVARGQETEQPAPAAAAVAPEQPAHSVEDATRPEPEDRESAHQETGNRESAHQGAEHQESGREGSGHRLNSYLDGTYLTLGPVAGALAIENSWNSAVGAELSIVRLREGHLPALLGVSLGAVVFDDRMGTRTWAELEVGFDNLLGWRLGRFAPKFGLSGGLAVEFDRVRPPRLGAQGTFWIFAGIVPYVRIGTLEEVGTFFEAGVMIKVPVKIRY